jgi:hypothetical protein
LAIVLGILLGLVLPEEAMIAVVTAKYILGQLITFCVPLSSSASSPRPSRHWATAPHVCCWQIVDGDGPFKISLRKGLEERHLIDGFVGGSRFGGCIVNQGNDDQGD